MSLAIDVDRVTAVLLADGWHSVSDDSFAMDAYEYVWYPDGKRTSWDATMVHGGGENGVCATGFIFKRSSAPNSEWIAGPLTSIVAVRYGGDR